MKATSPNLILGVSMTPHEQSLRRWFQFVVSGCVALGVAVLLTWMILVGEAPLFTWLLWALYAMQLAVLLLFLIIRRPWAIAVNEVGAPGETQQARVIRALSINTDHALLTLYGVLMFAFPVVGGLILFGATLLAPLMGGLWALLAGLVFVPLASVHIYASFWTVVQYGIVRTRGRVLETGRASLHNTNIV
jgi:hypothetical protein